MEKVLRYTEDGIINLLEITRLDTFNIYVYSSKKREPIHKKFIFKHINIKYYNDRTMVSFIYKDKVVYRLIVNDKVEDRLSTEDFFKNLLQRFILNNKINIFFSKKKGFKLRHKYNIRSFESKYNYFLIICLCIIPYLLGIIYHS